MLSFVQGITVLKPEADRAIIEVPSTGRQFTLAEVSPGLMQVLDILSAAGATEDDLGSMVEKSDGSGALARLCYYLLLFAERCMVRYSVSFDGRQLATLTPVSSSFRF